MTTCHGKSCSFGLPRVPFINCCQFMYLVISLFGFEGMIWDLIVSVPEHCLSFYFYYYPYTLLILWMITGRPAVYDICEIAVMRFGFIPCTTFA